MVDLIVTDPERVKIGEGFRCGHGCIIGADPLCTEFRDGLRVLKPPKGGVRIGRNVTLGSGVIIVLSLEEGTDTVIGDNAMIWHNSVIGHGCHIAENAVVGVGCYLSGLVRLEPWSYVAVGSVIAPEAHVGYGSMIGHGSNVRPGELVPSGEIWVGNPARFLKRNTWRPPV